MPNPIQLGGDEVRFADRIAQTSTVSASPAAGAETVIATLVQPTDLQKAIGVFLTAWLTVTIGTSGVSARVRIRQTNISGTVVADSGAVTQGIAAGNVCTLDVQAFDTAPANNGQTYVLTLTIGSGAAASTVASLNMTGISI